MRPPSRCTDGTRRCLEQALADAEAAPRQREEVHARDDQVAPHELGGDGGAAEQTRDDVEVLEAQRFAGRRVHAMLRSTIVVMALPVVLGSFL